MKTIGLLGGMSWESTLAYYKIINETVSAALGGLHSAQILLCSLDFDEIERCQTAGLWDRVGAILSDAAARLEVAGADFLVICSNTAHMLAPQIRDHVSIPLLHIAEVTAGRLREARIRSIGLLGTRHVLRQTFITDVLVRAGIKVLIPDDSGIGTVDAVIFGELCRGTVREDSKQAVLRTVENLKARGADGIVLGCTELGMLIGPDDAGIPVFDTLLIHAREAAFTALR